MPSTINKYEQDDYMHLDKKSFRILRSRLGSLSIPVDPFKSDVKVSLLLLSLRLIPF